MRKQTVAIILFAILTCLILTQARGMVSSNKSLSTSGSIDSPTFIVALDGSGDFTEIQSAINAVPNGTVGNILVRAGRYLLNPVFTWPPNQIVLKSKITLRGEGIDKTIIEMAPSTELATQMREDVITTTGDVSDVILKDFTVIQHGIPDNMGSSCVYFRAGTHKNIAISRVRVIDAFGGGIAIPRVTNLTIEDCIVERVWTGIAMGGGSHGLIRGNTVLNTSGDGILPQGLYGTSVTNLIIENNHVENVGDTGIDITSTSGGPPHERITARNNTLKNAHIRVSYAQNVELIGNTIVDGNIDVDNGAGKVANVTVRENKITTGRDYGIGFYGAQDCSAINNDIHFYSGANQVGIAAGIWGIGLIEGNSISNSSNYGVDFAGWRFGGGSTFTISANNVTDFGKYGVYDGGNDISIAHIVGNIIVTNKPTALWGILTDLPSNPWLIENNALKVLGLVGNAAIHAPGSTLIGNGPP